MLFDFKFSPNFVLKTDAKQSNQKCCSVFLWKCAPAAHVSQRVQVPNPPGSGKDIAEGKGVHREVESEGSRMWEQTNHGQISGLTNRNYIEGYA